MAACTGSDAKSGQSSKFSKNNFSIGWLSTLYVAAEGLDQARHRGLGYDKVRGEEADFHHFFVSHHVNT